jgi:hypothetical protein
LPARILDEPAVFSEAKIQKPMRAGKLNNVAPGEPAVNEQDLKSFLKATAHSVQ